MKKKEQIILIIIVLIVFLVKEEIYNFLYKMDTFNKIENKSCEIKNKTLETKYQELINQYNYDDFYNFNLEKSKILYRNIYNLDNKITIYKGFNNNILENHLVINDDGLVGIISKVNKNSSEVKLLTSKDLKLSIKVNNSYGILEYADNTFKIKGINNLENVEVGDKVYTSNLSIYPENIFIGTVTNSRNNHYEIEKDIIVSPAVNFNDIKFVSVITTLRG